MRRNKKPGTFGSIPSLISPKLVRSVTYSIRRVSYHIMLPVLLVVTPDQFPGIFLLLGMWWLQQAAVWHQRLTILQYVRTVVAYHTIVRRRLSRISLRTVDTVSYIDIGIPGSVYAPLTFSLQYSSYEHGRRVQSVLVL